MRVHVPVCTCRQVSARVVMHECFCVCECVSDYVSVRVSVLQELQMVFLVE